MIELRIGSPKRDATARRGWQGFFPYYAGFTDRFAMELLASANLEAGQVVWDPWNGSGTTTYAASSLRLDGIGTDLNPVMVIVARARLLPASEADSLIPMAMKIVAAAKRSKAKVRDDDPLCQWFDEYSASRIRNLDRAIRHHLVGTDSVRLGPNICLNRMSGIAASLYVCFFAVCRESLIDLQSSNPTWYRERLELERKESIEFRELSSGFLEQVLAMRDELSSKGSLPLFERGGVHLNLGDSSQSRVAESKADFVLTSPPYCTRIDYAASTRIELAIVGPWLATDPLSLSRAMIGTTRVPKLEPSPNRSWGSTCISFLRQVRDHPSKASRSYYYKNHLDYFSKMARSMAVLSLGMKPNAVAALVVQDSFYKDVHNPLPSIIAEMGDFVGLRPRERKDFGSPRSMSGINTSSAIYRKHKNPVESVIIFKKEM